MHELAIAQSLVEVALEGARGEGAGRILSLRVRVGVLAGIATEPLRLGFEVARVGSPLENTRLEIEDVPAWLDCGICGPGIPLHDAQSFACPRCGAAPIRLEGGRDLELAAIEFEAEEFS